MLRRAETGVEGIGVVASRFHVRRQRVTRALLLRREEYAGSANLSPCPLPVSSSYDGVPPVRPWAILRAAQRGNKAADSRTAGSHDARPAFCKLYLPVNVPDGGQSPAGQIRDVLQTLWTFAKPTGIGLYANLKIRRPIVENSDL